MKKLYMLIIFILCFLLVLLFSLLLEPTPKEAVYEDYSDIILNNSSWIQLDETDLNSLILKTYSSNVLRIIESLENSIPIIFEVHGEKFSIENKNNFVVASGFETSSNVYIYIPDENHVYTKTTTSLEELLENASSFFINNNEEVFK